MEILLWGGRRVQRGGDVPQQGSPPAPSAQTGGFRGGSRGQGAACPTNEAGQPRGSSPLPAGSD